MSEEDKKRMWMKYYCEECKAWETRELFEAKLHEAPSSSSSSASALRSWGCVKLIHHGAFQTFRVAELNVDAEERDAAGPLKLDFPSIESPAATQPPPGQLEQKREAAEEASAPQTVNASLSNGSSQSKQAKRNVRSTYLRDPVAEAPSPINSQGAVTSSSPDEAENGLSTVHVESRSKDGEAATADTAGPEHHENGVHKRPRRLTAGDRGLAQALQYERPARVATKPLSEIHNVKPSEPSPAGMKRPKRVSAGLRGLMLSAENSKSAPRVSPKTQRTDDVSGVRTRSTAKKASKKNRKIGDLY